MDILDTVRQAVKRDQLSDSTELAALIKSELRQIMRTSTEEYQPPAEVRPRVVFIVGVNGVGKTTTIGKLAYRFHQQGKKVVVCASDTFRAAAIEQLEIWAQRSNATIIKKEHGADPGAVLYDSLDRAMRDQADIVLVDTAGRLHTKVNLMRELEKMSRIAQKKIDGAPHDVYLIIDATTGQNGLVQAREFLKTAGVSGLIVTKLDGTAKGGVVVAITKELKLPLLYVGVGEKIDDLIDFHVDDFVESLFSQNS
jgi:fused signal recognition particle receptor